MCGMHNQITVQAEKSLHACVSVCLSHNKCSALYQLHIWFDIHISMYFVCLFLCKKYRVLLVSWTRMIILWGT